MEEVFKNPTQFSKGINLHDLITTHAEFHIDMNFKRTKNGIDLTEYGDMIPDPDDESDTEDVFEHVEKKTEKMLLSSPDYLAFEELAAKMVDVPCRPSGAVKVYIIEEGDGSLVPFDAEVTIHYAAYWEKAKIPFDSSLTNNNGNPMRIRLGSGRCLPGLELALTSVRGPKARLTALLQPQVTWGKAGALPRIRPEPALFVISLYSVSDTGAQLTFNSLPIEEQTKFSTTIRTVDSLRTTASERFKQKRYDRAISLYQQALPILSLSRPDSQEEKLEIKKLKVKLFVNLAVCYYKLNKPSRVIDMCDNIDTIIDIQTHCKALFYKGKAYQMMGKMEISIEFYRKALKLEPNNKEIGVLLAEIDGKIRESREVEVKMWQRAFGNQREKRASYKVDEDFEKGAKEICEYLASSIEFTTVHLPLGLCTDEVACLRSLASQFQGLSVEENGEGNRKRVSMVRTGF